MSSRLLPPATIGILGGGQLGQMMALSAKMQGYKVVVLDPDPECPCSSIADTLITADYDDEGAFKRLCLLSDTVTYEFENVDVTCVEKFSKEHRIPQGSECLRLSQHRITEKDFARDCGLQTVDYRSIKSHEELTECKKMNFPILIKTCRFGYDGKGQWLLNSPEELDEIELSWPNEYIAEEKCSFEKEISVVICRSVKNTVAFEPFENTHSNGILAVSINPAKVSESLKKQAIEWTKILAEKSNYIGTMAVEYFVVGNQLYFNEMAPRPHNSGHATIEGYSMSQFDLHIRAICGFPLEEPRLLQPTVMMNLLGQDIKKLNEWLSKEDAIGTHIHLYSKTKCVNNRKMGHLTFTGATLDQALKHSESWRTYQ